MDAASAAQQETTRMDRVKERLEYLIINAPV
jgi:hypothetical protein